MSNSLYTLLEEQVLFEGRKEDVMAKYPNVPKETIETLSNADPSGNNKYLEWMVKQVANGARQLERIIESVRGYHDRLSLINPNTMAAYDAQSRRQWDGKTFERFIKSPKDINTIPDLVHLEHFVEFIRGIVSKNKEAEEMKKEADRIYEDNDILITSPKTHRASCHYGRHSAWCVATANTGHFANYTKNGTLYFFLSKKDKPYTRYWSDKDSGEPPYKTALLLKDNGQASWWSKGDSNYDNSLDPGSKNLPFLTQEMVDKILKHNKYVIENRKQREIERILVSKGFYKKGGGDSQSRQDFAGFVRTKIFKPEQLVSIIRNDNWLALYENSEAGKMVRDQLGPQVVYSLLREMITSVPNLIDILKDLHAQEFLTNAGKSFSDEENKELAGIIVNRLGKKPTASEVGGDVKMYVDKWTMTPEQWEQYSRTSSYFFIGDGKGDIENLVKGDRFNMKDHHALQMMMLRAKMKPGSGLYALVTDKDILDSFIGKGSSEIPPDVIQTIMSKAKKLGG